MTDGTEVENATDRPGEGRGSHGALLADFAEAVLDAPDLRFVRARSPREQAGVARWLFDLASARREGATTVAARSVEGTGRTELAVISANRPFLVDTLRRHCCVEPDRPR
jgi:hypothetical protein